MNLCLMTLGKQIYGISSAGQLIGLVWPLPLPACCVGGGRRGSSKHCHSYIAALEDEFSPTRKKHKQGISRTNALVYQLYVVADYIVNIARHKVQCLSSLKFY